MKYFFSFLTIFSVAVTLAAKSIPCRSGEVLNAEFTTTPCKIADFNELLFGKSKSRYYASVAIRLAPKRTISIFDYRLKIGNDTFPAVAIQKNYDGFRYTTENLKATGENDIFFLLFMIDANMSSQTYKLIANFQPISLAESSLRFVNLGNKPLSDSTTIKYDGNF